MAAVAGYYEEAHQGEQQGEESMEVSLQTFSAGRGSICSAGLSEESIGSLVRTKSCVLFSNSKKIYEAHVTASYA